jgi:hypothetical protein
MLREKRKGYEVVYLHVTVTQKEGKRRERRRIHVVTYVPKSTLGHLGAGNNRSKKGGSLVSSPVKSFPVSPALIPWSNSVSNAEDFHA